MFLTTITMHSRVEVYCWLLDNGTLTLTVKILIHSMWLLGCAMMKKMLLLPVPAASFWNCSGEASSDDRAFSLLTTFMTWVSSIDASYNISSSAAIINYKILKRRNKIFGNACLLHEVIFNYLEYTSRPHFDAIFRNCIQVLPLRR